MVDFLLFSELAFAAILPLTFIWQEYRSSKKLPKKDRWELLVERKGKFVPTGEVLPEGADPHTVAMKRGELERVSYSVRKVK